ncbi:hypothetical protein EBU99_13615 [bacterium]|nr:hypothetical protein [bacterium]
MSQQRSSIIVVLGSVGVLALKCTPARTSPGSDSQVETVAVRSNDHYFMLFPLNLKENLQHACFCNASWTLMDGQVFKQKAELINSKSVSFNDLVENAQAAAGFAATTSLTVSVLATTFCLAGTAGVGTPA